ncbi:MAG: hypothetical protein Greene041619_332 [Candidatus Peregrinibacteria bacterium Greene0416_19]|nr:MAG: hypothetical protein Greene041619_332 [Candidatus Peregrinibacteria bacterium Greene0416_19]
MFSDDDDVESLSTTRSIQRADHGKAERKEERERQGKSRNKDLHRLKRDMLKANVQKAPAAHHVRTFEERAQKQFQTVDDKDLSPDELIHQHEQQENAKEEAREERQTEMG